MVAHAFKFQHLGDRSMWNSVSSRPTSNIANIVSSRTASQGCILRPYLEEEEEEEEENTNAFYSFCYLFLFIFLGWGTCSTVCMWSEDNLQEPQDQMQGTRLDELVLIYNVSF